MTGAGAGRLPLAGVRVADFTWVIAGPLGTKWLAAYGAEVIKIERFQKGGQVNRGNMSPDSVVSFNNINVGKKSVALDMYHAEAREIARRLVAVSDLVVDNFSPDVLPRWGLSPADVHEINPRAVSVAMPALGATGPHRSYRGLGSYFQARAALDGLVGYPHRGIVDVGFAYADTTCNVAHGVIAILAALYHRNVTGEGQHVELRQLESTVNFLGPALLEQSGNGVEPRRMGSRSDHAAPHGTYRCAGEDQWCTVTVFDDGEWAALCGVMGRAELAADPRFAAAPARKRNEAELDSLVEAWTTALPAQEVMERLQAAGVAAGAVQNIADLLEADPQAAHREFYVRSGEGAIVEQVPFRLSGTPAAPEGRVAPLGRHTVEVLRDLLGYSGGEIGELLDKGVAGTSEANS